MAVPTDPGGMTTRKRRHIDVCLDDRVAYSRVTTGLERYCLPYNALTQTSLAHIDLSTEFLGASLQAPILIGAMTGGADLSGTINRNLAAAAQRLGVGMMLGSQRIMLGSALGEAAASSFTVRDVAPDVLLFGNIGLSQLTVAAVDDISNALKRVGADVLAVHANPLKRYDTFSEFLFALRNPELIYGPYNRVGIGVRYEWNRHDCANHVDDIV